MGVMLFVDILVLGTIIFIVWWFWIHKPRAKVVSPTASVIEISVADGVYTPATIACSAGRPLVLRFLRLDPAPCAEQVQFPTLDMSAELPLNKPVDVRLPALTAGDYPFSCQMQMYRGTLSIK
jgi:plastocyanin domain-containing protein